MVAEDAAKNVVFSSIQSRSDGRYGSAPLDVALPGMGSLNTSRPAERLMIFDLQKLLTGANSQSWQSPLHSLGQI